MFLTASLMLWELVVGNITNSITLVTDSFDMLYNFVIIAVSYFSFKTSSKTWKRSTFGWSRAPAVGSVINSVLLLSLCFHVSLNSVKRILVPEEIENTLFILITGVISLSVNILRVMLLRGSDFTAVGESDEDIGGEASDTAGVLVTNMQEVSGSVVVILSALAYWFSGWEHRHCFDPLLSLVVVVVMVVKVWPLLHHSSLLLLNCVPHHLELGELERALLESDQAISSIQSLQVWTLAGDRRVADCHIIINAQGQDYKGEGEKDLMMLYNRVLLSVKEVLNMRGVHETTVQIHHSINAISSVEICNKSPNVKC